MIDPSGAPDDSVDGASKAEEKTAENPSAEVSDASRADQAESAEATDLTPEGEVETESQADVVVAENEDAAGDAKVDETVSADADHAVGAEASSAETAEDEAAEDVSGDDNAAESDAAEADEVEESVAPSGTVQPLELIEENDTDEEINHQWYILKVQVNRENSICDALKRRVKVEGLDRYFGDVLVPTEDVREFSKSGKQRIVKRKLYPGYIVVDMTINDDTWFLVRETPGIGDFTGSAGKPTPLLKSEIDRIIKTTKRDEKLEEANGIKTAIKFKAGDRVRVKEGYFQNFEGEVETIDESNGRITVMINIFGRPTPVELDHWQVEDI